MSELVGFETSDLSELHVTSGTVASESTTVRTGGYSCKVTGSSSYAQLVAVTSGDWNSIRIYFRVSALPGTKQVLVTNAISPTEYTIYLNTTGALTVLVENGTESSSFGTVAANQWYRLELAISSTTVAARLDGGSSQSSTGDSITGGSLARFHGIGASDSAYYDDYYSQDEGASQGWSPDGQIEALRPNADSTDTNEDDWLPATSYTEVDDDPINDSTETYSDGANNQLWQLTSLTLGTINDVKVGGRLHDVGGYGGPAYIRSKVSTPENSSDLTGDLATSYGYHEFYPATIPSSQSELDSYQAGVASGHATKDLYCSECWVMVDYAEEAGAEIVGAVAVNTTIAATLAANFHEAITGSVALDTTIAATLAANFHEAITGSVTVPTTIAAGMVFSHNYAITGAITIPTTIAATLAANFNEAITGNISLDTTIAGSLAANFNEAITGNITVPTAIAADLDFTKHPSITGDVSVPLSIAAGFTLGWTLTGAVSVPITIAAGMEYSGENQITGDITVGFTIAATTDYTFHREITGSITVPTTIAASLSVGWTITGAVTMPLTVAGSMAYNQHPTITGAVSVPTTIAAALSVGWTLTGALSLPLTIAATLVFNKNPSIAGDITVSSTIAASMAFNRHPSLVGAVAVDLTVAGALDFTRNASLTGSITVPLTIAAGMVYNAGGGAEYVLSGTVALDLTVASTMLAALTLKPGTAELATLAPVALLAAQAPSALLASMAPTAHLEEQSDAV